jgi:hypothetical protein
LDVAFVLAQAETLKAAGELILREPPLFDDRRGARAFAIVALGVERALFGERRGGRKQPRRRVVERGARRDGKQERERERGRRRAFRANRRVPSLRAVV